MLKVCNSNELVPIVLKLAPFPFTTFSNSEHKFKSDSLRYLVHYYTVSKLTLLSIDIIGNIYKLSTRTLLFLLTMPCRGNAPPAYLCATISGKVGDARIDHGDSGGPVVVRRGNRYVQVATQVGRGPVNNIYTQIQNTAKHFCGWINRQ